MIMVEDIKFYFNVKKIRFLKPCLPLKLCSKSLSRKKRYVMMKLPCGLLIKLLLLSADLYSKQDVVFFLHLSVCQRVILPKSSQLTLIVPIMNAADDKFCNISFNFQKK